MNKPRANTAAATVQAMIREVWASGSTIAQLTEYCGISKDQFIRLRSVLALPLRLDRSLRAKPKREPIDARTIEERKREIQRGWNAETEYARRVIKTEHVVLRVVSDDLVQPGRQPAEPGMVERLMDLGDCK